MLHAAPDRQDVAHLLALTAEVDADDLIAPFPARPMRPLRVGRLVRQGVDRETADGLVGYGVGMQRNENVAWRRERYRAARETSEISRSRVSTTR